MQRTLRWCRCLTVPFVIFLTSHASQAQLTNAWTNAVSAHWESPSWSLGVLPDSTQAVAITNAGFKAVGIYPATVTGFSNSLTIGSLVLDGPTNGLNTLLLNFSGTAVPLHALNGAFIGTNGIIANFFSGFQVDNGGLTIQLGNYFEEGGTLVATNTLTSLQGGSMELTNAVAALGPLVLDTNGTFGITNLGTVVQSGGQVTADLSINNGIYDLIDGDFFGTCSMISQAGQFNQHGGTNFATFSLGYSTFLGSEGTGVYTLFNGSVITPLINLGPSVFAFGGFSQAGGTVNAAVLDVGSASGDFPGTGLYALTNGTLSVGMLSIANGGIEQMGGQITTSNGIVASGNFFRTAPRFVTYDLSGGNLNTPFFHFSYGAVTQSGGTNNIAQDLAVGNATYTLPGGTLLTANTTISFGTFIQGGTGERSPTVFLQTGGKHLISGALTNDDEYFFSGGSLVAGRIMLGGTLVISNGAVVTCPGMFDFGGSLRMYGSATETLGPVALSFFSTIDLEQGSHTLKFADSSGATWNSGMALLTITNWNGSTSGGGSDRVIFGNSAAGLTPAQVALIQFANPVGFPPGDYHARILSTGEIVPAALPPIALSQFQNHIVLVWTSGSVLQTSTNLEGPFTDIVGAMSPYTNTDTTAPNRFFRLRSQ